MTGKLAHLSACESEREEMYRLLKVGEDESFFDLGAYDGIPSGSCWRIPAVNSVR